MKKVGLFAAGVLFGTAGMKLLGSKDAKRAYAQTTAAALRAKEQLYGGQIAAEPLVVSTNRSPCAWCDYDFICCHYFQALVLAQPENPPA